MRQFLHDILTTDVALDAFRASEGVDIPVAQGEGLTTNQIAKPFFIYTLGNNTDEGLSETDRQPNRQFFTIYIHDVPADYTRIDKMIDLVKDALRNQRSRDYGIMLVRWLETSTDLDDETMGTIMRYVRFQAIREG